MGALDSNMALVALRATGRALEVDGETEPIVIILAGGVAGLLAGGLAAARTTDDCDVIWSNPREGWGVVEHAARRVADQLGLPPSWLNDSCRMHAWSLPIGWRTRCEPVERIGPLDVLRLARFDLMASKIIAAPQRPHDLEDLIHLRPNREELQELAAHVRRLAAEDLDRRSFKDQLDIIEYLRGLA
jgi:hypothetical protein